jgi:hypothetical protein
MSHEMPLVFSELARSAIPEESALGGSRLLACGTEMRKPQNVGGGDRMATSGGIGLSNRRAGYLPHNRRRLVTTKTVTLSAHRTITAAP